MTVQVSKDPNRIGLVTKTCGHDTRGIWHQTEVTGGKPPIVKLL
jgi:hypothetical protein